MPFGQHVQSGKLSLNLRAMSEQTPPLDHVVIPEGSKEGVALWKLVRDCISGSKKVSFESLVWDVFAFQFRNNAVYNAWCRHLGWTESRVDRGGHWMEIPALPVEFFRHSEVLTEQISEPLPHLTFRTSGTSGSASGIHLVRTPELYRLSATTGFRAQFGSPDDGGVVLLGLLPGYLERPDSSLVHMVGMLRSAGWMEPKGTPESGFHLDDLEGFFNMLDGLMDSGRKVVVMGVTWALVDAAEAWAASGRAPLEDRVQFAVTGGMKGKREEWVSERVQSALKTGFGCHHIGGEYGMTELLSQAWSKSAGVYQPPPWMRIRLRRTDDPLTRATPGSTGGVDVLDLANLGSCSFLATQDLARPAWGRKDTDAFELLGRFDRSEVRGCNLLVQ